MPAVLLLFFLMVSPAIYAQDVDLFADTEGDSLLFGEEFDLGGDDFSFDLEDDTATDELQEDEDDFFGDFDDEVDSTLVEDEPADEDDWGFGDDLAIEDSLAADSLDTGYSDHPWDLRKSTDGTIFQGTGFTLSLYSPQKVSEALNTWYSFLDYSLSIELPWHYELDPVEISFMVDLSSFNFKNSYPAGGEFKGLTVMPAVRAEAYGFEIEAGAGMYYPTFGIMTGVGYTLQYHSLFVSTGYRWNWASNIDPLGSGWWLEPRLTMGVKFW